MIRVTKDGRTIRTGKHYTEFRRGLHEAQGGQCFECGRDTLLAADHERDWAFHVDHLNGRGMGGSKRDDTFDACKGKCGRCHRRKHGQQ